MLAKLFLTLFVVLLASSAMGVQTAVPNFPLVNQEGKPFQLHDLKGKHLFVSFIFTRCPMEKMCPLTVSLNKSLYRKWKNEKSAPDLHFLFVTLDPEFDTPIVLKKFATGRDLSLKHFTLATGAPQVLSDFASEFNVLGIPSNGSANISHNLKSILIGPDMVPIQEFKDNEWEPKMVLDVLLSKKNS